MNPPRYGPCLRAWAVVMVGATLLFPGYARAQGRRVLGGRPDFSWTELPAGRLRTRIEQLPPRARQAAEAHLRTFEFPPEDAGSLDVDGAGAVFYADHFPPAPDTSLSDAGELPAGTSAAAVPVSPFPDALKFHSRPGAANVLFLDFDGHIVSGTAWNGTDGVNRDPIPAVAFSTDSDYSTYSDAEQLAIKRIWQRIAEDYAPFNIDVTTEEPATFGTRTARALITRNTDANSVTNPASTAGGVAYVNVFASSSYAYYSPAWIYANNLSYREDYIAEAAAHEIGHNMGLSHDGKTDGTEYYNGHGTGETSWAPIMGTGYGRNVSQWSKGEYALANNTQDDLSIIAGKLTYRTDDAGGTPATTAYLQVETNGAILATTPDTDPANARTANKGVLERNTDIDVYSFLTDTGTVRLAAIPWVSPADTRGGNTDLRMRLLDAGGAVLADADPADQTGASIVTNLAAGQYFVELRGVGTGNPTNTTPTGYTVYGSIGQYFITGSVVRSSAVIPPTAALTAADITTIGLTQQTFQVTYIDNLAVDASSLDDSDIRVTGPDGYDAAARLVSVNVAGDGTPRTATYAVSPPGSAWIETNNGTYEVSLQAGQVSDTEGASADAGPLGTFECRVPRLAYEATMDTNPGWTLEGGWAYGRPTGSSGDPSAGYTGTNVVGFVLTGSYSKSTPVQYATTPAINCSAATTVQLQFQRKLGVRSSDTASLQASPDGTNWTTVWTAGGTISDTAWTAVQYDLSPVVAGHAGARVRWAMGANSDTRVSFGWNLDDVQIYADGATPDTAAPGATLVVADVTAAGPSMYVFTVTFTDNVAVAVATLGDGDVIVTGPNGFTNAAVFVEVDTASNGTPRIATYEIDAPGGTWDATDNGTYEVTLPYGEVADTAGNETLETVLGAFTVHILPVWALSITPSPTDAGTITPSGGEYVDGSVVQLEAASEPYFQFESWTGALDGTNNPLTIVMTSNVLGEAVFGALMTSNHPTPLWWLAAQGVTDDFESAVAQIGANGRPLWESYVAGLDPTNTDARFELGVPADLPPVGQVILQWDTVSGRVYTVQTSTNLPDGFQPLPGAVRLPWTDNCRTSATPGFFRIEVERE